MKKIFIIIILLLICCVGCDFSINKPDTPTNSNVITTLNKIDFEVIDSPYVENNDQNFKDEYLLNNFEEYEKMNNEYNLLMNLTEEDFKNNTYLLFFYLNDCGYDKGIKEIGYEDDKLEIVYNIREVCGFCQEHYYGGLVKLPKLNTNNVEISIKENILKKEECDPNVAYKPILYLYPESHMYVSVQMEKSNNIITSYPKYNDGWNVFVEKDGTIILNDKMYYALYWDEYNDNVVDFHEGFYVTKDSAISFLEEKLNIIGLNYKEANEFIMYWLPVLEANEQSLVYFELTEEREKNNQLYIEPKPDSLLRINMHIKKVDKEIKIKEQKLNTFERKGFTAIEWGGTIHTS